MIERFRIALTPFRLFLILVAVVAIWLTVPRAIFALHEDISRARTYFKPAADLRADEVQRLNEENRALQQDIKLGNNRGADNALQLYIQLGANYETLGFKSLAVDAYTRAARIDTKSYVPYNDLGSLYLSLNQYPQAEDAFRKAIDANPDFAPTYIRLADLYLNDMKDQEKARGVYIDGIMKTKNSAELVRAFAQFLDLTENYSESYLYWKFVLQINPKDETAKQKLEQLKIYAPR